MKTGVVVFLDGKLEEHFKKASAAGFTTCQLVGWELDKFTEEYAEKTKEYEKKYGMEVSAFWCGWSGPQKWNFKEGPHTLGLVPVTYRAQRIKDLKKGSDFAKMIGVTDVVTHMGFIPENPMTEEYMTLVIAIREVAEYFKNNGQYLLFETGQETPTTLMRTIHDVGTGNMGINIDPANLILYGKANPIDALEIFGKLVRGVHAKDGLYPTDGENLGTEVPVGEGKTNFPKFIKLLKEIGYDGAVTIEREISGEQRDKDIAKTKVYLEELFAAN